MAQAQFSALDPPLRDPDNVIVPVTYRIRDGVPELSFAFQKEFERAGQTERTTWLQRRHIEGLRRLLEKLPGHLDLSEDRVRAGERAKR